MQFEQNRRMAPKERMTPSRALRPPVRLVCGIGLSVPSVASCKVEGSAGCLGLLRIFQVNRSQGMALLIPTFFCPKAWESMTGNDAVRFCSYCKKEVHNLAAMSARERLTLLSSPAANLCSRYQVAIRRPAKGKESAYYRHLAKYGVGVALTGSVLLVLWETHGDAEKERYYRAAGTTAGGCDMPRELYEEQRAHLKGDVQMPEDRLRAQQAREAELKFRAEEVERAIEPLEESPAKPADPAPLPPT